MGLLGFGKKEDDFNLGLPELPSFSDRRSLPELPSMPSTNMGNRFNNEMVKSAVMDSSGEMGDTNNEDLSQQEDYYSLMQPIENRPQRPKSNELVWVRIDKFQEAQRDFNEVKKKVKEIDLLLREVKAINQKEDAQVTEWVRDLEKVKTLLVDVDSKVFNQI